MGNETSAWDFQAKTIDGKPKRLSTFKGKVALIVNTASQCGMTPQYKGLQQLYEQYQDRGFVVLGFPSNQFGNQEPGSNDEIAEFCETNYGVSFPMFARIDVNGADAHPLFGFLKSSKPGALGTEMIKWNFTKFLLDRDGRVVARYGPTTEQGAIAAETKRLPG
jgi:glutathione peroxidase